MICHLGYHTKAIYIMTTYNKLLTSYLIGHSKMYQLFTLATQQENLMSDLVKDLRCFLSRSYHVS